MCDRIASPASMAVPPQRRRRIRKVCTGLRDRAWWLIRALGKPFTVDDLLFTISDGGAKDPAGNLARYLLALERAGVLARLQRRAPGRSPTSNGLVIWRLVRDLGPRAPVRRRDGQGLWDPNANQLMPCPAAKVMP